MNTTGEMDERFKSPPWKGGTGVTLSRVRISLSPPTPCFIQFIKALNLNKIKALNATYRVIKP